MYTYREVKRCVDVLVSALMANGVDNTFIDDVSVSIKKFFKDDENGIFFPILVLLWFFFLFGL